MNRQLIAHKSQLQIVRQCPIKIRKGNSSSISALVTYGFPVSRENDGVASIGIHLRDPPPVSETVRGQITFLEGFDLRACRDVDLRHFNILPAAECM
jgi:hypothetical protein